MFLGEGSYGQVRIRDGKAVKKFSKLSHLIQEYMALRYLDNCEYVVHAKDIDFPNLELHMELYDCSLRKWLEEQSNKGGPKIEDVLIILRDVLRGLVELHDRGLAHGDLKPGNILVKRSPLRAVLGDCGFVSIAKYAKVDRTAKIYRDPTINHDISHDMFSFGICFLEIIGDIKFNRQAEYKELREAVYEKVENREYRKIIYNLLHPDRNRRPDARSLLYRLFRKNPPRWRKEASVEASSNIVSVLFEDRRFIRRLMKDTAHVYKINRGKKGYGALLSYIDNHQIPVSKHRLYTGVTLMILSAIFGRSGFREEEVLILCENRHSETEMYEVLNRILSDQVFIKLLLAP
jgi:serine/threonine protein kinase